MIKLYKENELAINVFLAICHGGIILLSLHLGNTIPAVNAFFIGYSLSTIIGLSGRA